MCTLAMASTLCVTCFQSPQRAAAASISPYCINILDGLNWNSSGQVRNATSSWRSGAIACQQQQKKRGWSWRVLCSENGVEEEVNVQGQEEEDVEFDISRLEKYTERVPNEVLRVHATVDGEEDQVIIFKGFSSSLMRSTEFNPAESVLPPTAIIQTIDRLRGPFDPSKVRIIKGGRGLSWRQFHEMLTSKGL